MANTADSDETAPVMANNAVCFWSTLISEAYLSENLGK